MAFYVTMTDKFMSGWGGAQGRIAKYVVQCDTILQAEAIEQAALRRSEMKHVNLRVTQPRYGSRYQVTLRHFSDLGGPWLEYYREEV